MLVIKTVDEDSREVTLELSGMENGCIKFSISGKSRDATAILDDAETEEVRKWLS